MIDGRIRWSAARLGLACVALVASTPLRAQRIANELRPAEAFLGQDVRFYVQAQDARSAECVLEPVDGLTFELEDQGVSNQSTQISIINGRRQVRETANYTLVYRVKPARAGRFVIPAPAVKVDGRALLGSASVLVVNDPSSDDRAIVEFHAEPSAIVLGQDGKLLVDVFLKHVPSTLNTRDPLDLYDQAASFSFFDQGTPPPELTLPWLLDPPQGLGALDLQGWVRGRQVRRGFQLAGVRGGRFLEEGQVSDVQRDDANGKLTRYRRYRFTFPIRGEAAGGYEFAPVALQGQLVSPSGDRFVWREAYARSAPLHVDVLEPPLEGRPATFTGGVGTFTLEMEPPTPTMLRLGDAVYVTLVVRGQGFLKGVHLDVGAQLGTRFRVESVGTTDSLPVGAERPPGFPDRPGSWRQWDYKVYPTSADLTEIPALSFSWFDPRRREYATSTTAAVPITVQPATGSPSDVVVASGSSPARRDVELVATAALSANITDVNALGDQTASPWSLLGVLLVLPLVYFGLSFVVVRRRRLRQDPALLRRRRAASRAQTRLRDASAATGIAAIQGAHAALRGYVADLTDADEVALTGDDLLRWLAAQGCDAELCGQVRRLGELVDAANYGGAVDAHDRSLLTGLERILRAGARLGAVFLLCLSLAAQDAAGPAVQFTEAQAKFDARDFAAAAHIYEQMLEGGSENGAVLYNLGNAYLRNGELGRAIAAYRRASLLMPGDANLDVNLRRALDARRTPLSAPSDQGVLDYVMFWRPHLTFRSELELALLAGGLAFVLATLRLLSGRSLPALRWTVIVLSAATLLLAISSILDYRWLTARDRAVVTVDGTLLRTGPGDGYDARFEQPLDEGAELRIQARRDGWLRVVAGGQYEGWLPETTTATW